MATRPYVLDGFRVNILKDWRLNPHTSAERLALGAELDQRHSGLPVFEVNGASSKLYIWTGSAWKDITGSGGGGGGGSSSTIRVYNETPAGANNGINLVFTVSQPFEVGTTFVTVNGVKQKPGSGNDYTEGSDTITFLHAIPANANILVDYDYDSAGAPAVVRVINDTPSGANNGINLIFTTSLPYTTATTVVTVNGIKQKPGAGNDYLESGASQITFLNPLPANANILIDYNTT